MSRRAFTLIELLVIVAILSVMVTVGVVSITAGKAAYRVKGATRDIFGAIRHARSVALVTGQPAIITYSTAQEDGEVVAKVEITSAKLFDAGADRSNVETLSGEPIKGAGQELVHIEGSKAESFSKTSAKTSTKAGTKTRSKTATKGVGKSGVSGADGTVAQDEGGESIEDILFAPMDSEVVKGMRVKVVKGDENLAEMDTGRKSKVSVFSNVDYLLGRFKDAKAEEKKKEEEKSKTDGTTSKDAPIDEEQEPVSVVWETNGRVEPHQVWVYADGQKPEDGLMIRIDRFGAAKVLSGDGREEKE